MHDSFRFHLKEIRRVIVIISKVLFLESPLTTVLFRVSLMQC